MALNIRGMRERRKAVEEEQKKRGGGKNDLYKFEFGQTAIYIPPPLPSMNGFPFLEYFTHHNLQGQNQGSAVCLGLDNEGLWNDATLEQLQARVDEDKLKMPSKSEGCNGCKAHQGELPDVTANIPADRVKKMFPKETYAWPVVPWGTIEGGKLKEFPDKECRLTLMGPQLWDALAAQIELNGDVTDPDQPVLLIVIKTKTGNQQWNVEYSAGVWGDSIRNPPRLSKPLKASIRERLAPGGDCDPHRLVANFTKDNDQIMTLLGGDSIKEVAGKGEAGEPACFGLEADPDDPDCQGCAFKIACGKKTGVDMSDSDAEDEPASKKPVRARKPNAPRSVAEADALLGGVEIDPDDDIPETWEVEDEDDDGVGADLDELERELEARKSRKK